MNSIQKQTPLNNSKTYEIFIATFEKKLLGMVNVIEVDLLMKKLQYLGVNFDPFGTEAENECLTIMDQLELTDHLKDPYLATNIILRLLDITEERLNNLRQ